MLELGAALAVFCAAAIVLLFLFCLLTRCHAHAQAEHPPEQEGPPPEHCRGLYRQFKEKQQYQQRKQRQSYLDSQNSQEQDNILVEMGDLRKMFQLNSTDIYSPSIMAPQSQSLTPASLATFHPHIPHSRSRVKFQVQQLKSQRRRFCKQTLKKSIKLVMLLGLSEETGITMVRRCKQALIVRDGVASVEWVGQERIINWMDQEYDDCLQVLGWEEGERGCRCEEWEIDISSIRQGERHPLKLLSTNITRKAIDSKVYCQTRQEILTLNIKTIS